MAKFFDIEIQDSRLVYSGLQDIFGLGKWEAKCTCIQFGVGNNIRIKDLESEQWQEMVDWVQSHGMVERERRNHIYACINKAKQIHSYKGVRHAAGYPVRGQRTHTNASRKRAIRRK
jgi:small subunit ribosomal protein S13